MESKKAKELTGSMGPVSPASDDTAMKSFCGLSQKNIRDRRNGTTRSELTYAIVFWIGRTKDRRRSQRPR
jgi:hypothetical protein